MTDDDLETIKEKNAPEIEKANAHFLKLENEIETLRKQNEQLKTFIRDLLKKAEQQLSDAVWENNQTLIDKLKLDNGKHYAFCYRWTSCD